jgi:hypothetical protein
MHTTVRLFAVDIVKRDLGFYLTQKVISKEAASKLKETWISLVKDLAKDCDKILAGFSIPTHALYAPIGEDYVEYNESDNRGEARARL